MNQGAAILAFTLLASAAGELRGQDSLAQPRKVAIGDGVELAYIERGQGVPVIFVHGTLGDYSVWEAHVGAFAANYHALAYSRRYNYPNSNKLRPKHSALVEAEDLAAFINKLNLGKVHVVGHSYGAYTALFLAVKHPELVRTLTLAEPPVVFTDDPLDETKEHMIKRSRVAFAKGDAAEAVGVIINSSEEGKFEKMPKIFQSLLLRNAPELRALVTSDEMYPPLDREAVRRLAAPTLLLSGENTTPSLKWSVAELERLLPEKGHQHLVIKAADHGMWFQQPETCRNAVIAFLAGK
jgi:pimeloyl-ACP methyl ester carboxylesterase